MASGVVNRKPAGRSRSALRAALVAIPLVGVVAAYVAHAWATQHGTTDTLGLLQGVAVIDRCLQEGDWTCGDAGYGAIGPSALLQYIPGLLLKWSGETMAGAARGLSLVNSAAFLLTVVLLWRTGQRVGDRVLAGLLCLVAVTGPTLWYSTAGFGEGLGVLMVTAFACALVVRANGFVLAITVFFAAISKEPALPFLLGLAYFVLRSPAADGRRVTKGQLAGLAIGAAAAFATNWGFNQFRYGGDGGGGVGPLSRSITNVEAPAPTLAAKAESFLSLIFAPNVGLVWFWPVALGCIVLGLVAAWKASGSLRRFAGSPAFGALAILGLFTAGVASFNAPYGFISWGPRYLVPWMPAFAVVALHRDWPIARQLLERALRPPLVKVAAAVVVAVLALGQVAAFIHPGVAYAHFTPDAACRGRLLDVTLWYRAYGEMESYYECTRHFAWTKGPILTDALSSLSASQLAFLPLYVAGLAALAVVVVGVRAPPGSSPPGWPASASATPPPGTAG